MPCSFRHERACRERGILQVAGIDEAGRGPLAGPVVAAAVVFLRHRVPRGLNDSKKLRAAVRTAIYERLTADPCVVWAVSVQDVETIDRLNILRATHKAMREAFAALTCAVEHALIDGLPVPDFPVAHTALVGGDGLCHSIAAASVIAKVTRDRLMEELDALYPLYGFCSHKGYATRDHLDRLRIHGPCPVHRRSFEPVAQGQLF